MRSSPPRACFRSANPQNPKHKTMNTHPLKTAVAGVAALALAAFTLAPITAEAGGGGGPRYSHRCDSCNQPVYQRLVVVGHDSCGRPIMRWITDSHRCGGHQSSRHFDSHSRYDRGCDSRGRCESSGVGLLRGIIELHEQHRRQIFGR